MDRLLIYSKTITMISEICCSCGICFGIPSDFQESVLKTKQSFYCPNGHSMSYTKSTAEKLKEELDSEKQKNIRDTNFIRQQLIIEENKRKESERKLKRVHNGVCPCCNRSFTNLQRHMKTKHPEIIPNELVVKSKKIKRNFLENDTRK